eukprot:gene3037-2019_t
MCMVLCHILYFKCACGFLLADLLWRLMTVSWYVLTKYITLLAYMLWVWCLMLTTFMWVGYWFLLNAPDESSAA